MEDGEKASLYMQLASYEQRRCEGRKGAEWQMNIAVWGALTLFSVANLQGNVDPQGQLAAMWLAGVILLHLSVWCGYVFFWSLWLHDANWRDRRHAGDFVKEVTGFLRAEGHGLGEVKSPGKRSFSERLTKLLEDRSANSQIVVTTVLLVVHCCTMVGS